MAKLLRVGVLAALFIITMSFMEAGKEPVGKITFPLNRVFVLQAGSSQPQTASYNMDVFSGDKIETKKESRCEITMNNGNVVRIDENSIYTLENVKVTPETVKAESFLGSGKLWSTIRKIFSKDDYFKVKSPSAVIAVRGTIYRVDVQPDSTTQLRVYDGEVEVTPYNPSMGALEKTTPGEQPKAIGPPRDVPGPTTVSGPRDVTMEEWLEIVKAQQQIVVSPDGSFQKSDFNLEDDAKSDWVQWNKQRDELLGR
ncbi:MAG: FecR family protein [Calditrichia bacterium]